MEKDNSLFNKIKVSLLDQEKYIKLVRLIAYIALFIVALFMTALNVLNFGLKDPLTLTGL